MKIIYNSSILGVELQAGSADPEYPVENVINEYPRKPFRAAGSTATIRVLESGKAQAFALFATNADLVTITSVFDVSILFGTDENGDMIQAGTDESGGTIELSNLGDVEEPLEYTYVKQNENNRFIYIDFDVYGLQRTVDIACESLGQTLEVGVIDAGQVMRFREMERESYQETPRDFGVDQELQSGNPYYVDLGQARVIPFYVIMWAGDGDDPAGYDTWWDFYYNYIRALGKTPRTWLLSENRSSAHYGLWGRLEEMPKTATHGEAHMFVSIKLREIN